MDLRARAHYDAAVRYKRAGNAAKARSHFGRAVHYAKLGQRFGGSVEAPGATADAVTELLRQQVPIAVGNVAEVSPSWAPYFEKRTEEGERFGRIRATKAMEAAINVHNSFGQSILYCVYRYMSAHPEFSASLGYIRAVPGIDLAITNQFTHENSYREEETDMALSGLAADHPSMHFILDEIQTFGKLSAEAADALHAPKSNVFGILHSRISGKKGYKPLTPVAAPALAASSPLAPLAAKPREGKRGSPAVDLPEKPHKSPKVDPKPREGKRGSPAVGLSFTEKPHKSPKVDPNAGIEVFGKEWFQTLFGFVDDEQSEFDQNWARFAYDAQTGVLSLGDDPSRTWKAGKFEVVRFGDLYNAARKKAVGLTLKSKGQRTTVRFVSGDVAILHSDPEYAGACFQAASQFNCLEFANKDDTPEMGVAKWVADLTQGPACAISCGAGTIVRTYFAHEGGTQPQRAGNQINTLDDVIEDLTDKAGAARRLVDVRNGYTDSDAERLAVLATTVNSLSDDDRKRVMYLLKVGVQIDTQVTCKRTAWSEKGFWHLVPNGQLVTQVYASALAVSAKYACCEPDAWGPLARLVLEAAYKATIYAAILHAQTPRPKVVLTALGGDQFGNKKEWIADAMVGALSTFAPVGIDVVINEFRAGDLYYIRDAIARHDRTRDLLV